MSFVRDVARGLGIQAFGDPPLSPGSPRGMSYGAGSSYGRLLLVPGKGGRAREATYMQIYHSNPFVYAAANYIARGVGRLPLHVFGLDADGEKQRLRGDVATRGPNSAGANLDLVLNRPVERISRAAFYSGTLRQRLILGNALWEILRDRGGPPTGVRRIPWQKVTHVEEDGDGNVLWYEVREGLYNGRRRVLGRDEVVHFGLGSEGDQACGVSLLESCRSTIALHDAMLRHLLGYAANSMRPSGHFKLERASREKMKELRELMTELYVSPENAGRILFSTGEWQPMSDSPDHAQIVELLKESRLEIATAFQTPPPILGMLEHAIRANVKEMREQYGRDTLGPWTTETEDELEAQLIQPSYRSTFCEFQLAEQLRPDLEARALVYQRLMFVMAIDEIRTIENLPKLNIKGVTDIPWVPSGAMPLTTAAENRLQRASEPPRGGDDDAGDGEQALLPLSQVAALIQMADDLGKSLNGQLSGYNHDTEEVLT